MSAARSPRAAADGFLATLGAVVRCVTDRRLTVPSDYRAGNLYAATFEPRVQAAPLRASHGGPRGLFLDVVHLYEIVEAGRVHNRAAWRVVTRMYGYYLVDHDGRELLAYHWQPGPDFAGPDYPHLHISAAVSAQIDAVTAEEIDLDARHVVTGRISLASVVGMLITEFGVAPRRGDWRQALERAETDDTSRESFLTSDA